MVLLGIVSRPIMLSLRRALFAFAVATTLPAFAQSPIAVVPVSPTAGSSVTLVAPFYFGACPSPSWITVIQSPGQLRINVDFPTVPPPSTCPNLSASAGPLAAGHYVVEAYSRVASGPFSLFAIGAFDVVEAVPVPGVALETGGVLCLLLLVGAAAMYRLRRRPSDA